MKRLSLTEVLAQIEAPKRYNFDSFVVGEALMFDEFKAAESARVAAYQFVKRRNNGWKFSMRKSRSGWVLIRTA